MTNIQTNPVHEGLYIFSFTHNNYLLIYSSKSRDGSHHNEEEGETSKASDPQINEESEDETSNASDEQEENDDTSSDEDAEPVIFILKR